MPVQTDGRTGKTRNAASVRTYGSTIKDQSCGCMHRCMGVDHRLDRGTRPPPLLFEVGGRNVFCPPYFLREQILMFQIYKITTVLAQLLGGGATHVRRAACPIRMKLLHDRQRDKR